MRKRKGFVISDTQCPFPQGDGLFLGLTSFGFWSLPSVLVRSFGDESVGAVISDTGGSSCQEIWSHSVLGGRLIVRNSCAQGMAKIVFLIFL
jgi:hypothetical protein